MQHPNSEKEAPTPITACFQIGCSAILNVCTPISQGLFQSRFLQRLVHDDVIILSIWLHDFNVFQVKYPLFQLVNTTISTISAYHTIVSFFLIITACYQLKS